MVQFGPYRILERIGEGGMCQVFRARHQDADADCALKVLRDDVLDDARIRDLFMTEADLSLLLRHRNLVRSDDAGECQGRAYIAMELLDGGTLDDLAERLASEGAPLPDDLVLFVVSEMLRGLDALHDAKGGSGRPLGIVHRDVTPHNVFLGLDGRVVLGDYGVAHIEAHGADLDPDVPGKLAYLAPESLTKGPVDRRADVFSTGVFLYELLLGRRPFQARDDSTTMDLIVDARTTRPRRIRADLPIELDNLMMSTLAKRPRDRPQTAAALREALEPFFDRQLANERILGALMQSLSSGPPPCP